MYFLENKLYWIIAFKQNGVFPNMFANNIQRRHIFCKNPIKNKGNFEVSRLQLAGLGSLY